MNSNKEDSNLVTGMYSHISHQNQLIYAYSLYAILMLVSFLFNVNVSQKCKYGVTRRESEILGWVKSSSYLSHTKAQV